MSRTGSIDPHAQEDRDDPRLATHYRRKEAEPSELLVRIAREEARIEATGEQRTTPCVVCGAPVVIETLAYAAGVVFNRQLAERGEELIKPQEVGFTCQGECYGRRRARMERVRQGVADAYRHYTEEPDDDPP